MNELVHINLESCYSKEVSVEFLECCSEAVMQE